MLALFSCLAACVASDVGQPCPQLLGDIDPVGDTGDPTISSTLEAVGQDLGYPCHELICVASGGKPGYCSSKCLDDASCPEGFECRNIQSAGPFSNTKLCAWKACQKRQDCGPAEQFCCEATPAGTRLCRFAKEGPCS